MKMIYHFSVGLMAHNGLPALRRAGNRITNFQNSNKMNKETKAENMHVSRADGKPPVAGSASYRQSFGLDNPPKGEVLNLKYAEGVRYYLLWTNCPDNENIVEAWFPTKTAALKYAKDNGWAVS